MAIAAALSRADKRKGRESHLQDYIHLPDRTAVADADALISRFGEHAASEAARLAGVSRSLGNVVNYCRWRQIERMIGRLAEGPGQATRH